MLTLGLYAGKTGEEYLAVGIPTASWGEGNLGHGRVGEKGGKRAKLGGGRADWSRRMARKVAEAAAP